MAGSVGGDPPVEERGVECLEDLPFVFVVFVVPIVVSLMPIPGHNASVTCLHTLSSHRATASPSRVAPCTEFRVCVHMISQISHQDEAECRVMQRVPITVKY